MTFSNCTISVYMLDVEGKIRWCLGNCLSSGEPYYYVISFPRGYIRA